MSVPVCVYVCVCYYAINGITNNLFNQSDWLLFPIHGVESCDNIDAGFYIVTKS